ncbi:MAG: nucleoside deaminase [Oscillospiraceae bacterium]|nr:nucleoside deaminase [Oscillospiraceae bacterium]
MTDRDCMARALELAREAAQTGDVPVGCVIVRQGEIIAQGRNRREDRADATAHAEMEAIRSASRRLGRWRLEDCTLYVTLEPCPMCAGAIWNARLGRVVFGAGEERSGCCGSRLHLGLEGFTPFPPVKAGVLEEECRAVLGDFFAQLRQKEKKDGDFTDL